MPEKLSEKTVDIIKSSAALITSNKTEITVKMFDIIISKYPELSKYFTHFKDGQYLNLAEALSNYAINIDKIDLLMPSIEMIAKQHLKADVKPHLYPVFGRAFIEAIEDVLKEKASIEFVDAWREAYKYISSILIELEDKFRKNL